MICPTCQEWPGWVRLPSPNNEYRIVGVTWVPCPDCGGFGFRAVILPGAPSLAMAIYDPGKLGRLLRCSDRREGEP